MDDSLIFATRTGQLQEIRSLLQKGVDINAACANGTTALIIASTICKKDIVIELMKDHKLDVNHQENDGWTALHMASFRGYTEIVVELLKHDEREPSK